MTLQGDRKKYAFDGSFGDPIAQEKLAKGLEIGARIAGSTLGPGGRTVIVGRKHRTPLAVDDGYTTIQNLILEDELENLGILSLVDVATHTLDVAKDGTTTAMLLTQGIHKAGSVYLSSNPLVITKKTPLEIHREIEEQRDLVIAELKKRAKTIEKADIKNVAYTAYANATMAEIVANTIHEVGENGLVIVEEGFGRETEVDIMKGMRFAGKFAGIAFANSPDEDIYVENHPILVTDFRFQSINDFLGLVPCINATMKSGHPGIVLIADKIERVVLNFIARTNAQNAATGNTFRMYPITVPSLTPSEYEDLAIFLGARYWSKEHQEAPANVTHTSQIIIDGKPEEVSNLGKADTFHVTSYGEGVALGGQGSKEAVAERVKELKVLWENQEVKMIKTRLEFRIAALDSSVAKIKVASPSDAETEHIRLKTKNAVHSAQSAITEGVVKGGGLAFKEIAESLPHSLLTDALKVPYEKIQENAGKLDIPDTVLDSVKTLRIALIQACSQAWILLTTSVLIEFRNEPDYADAARIITEGYKGEKLITTRKTIEEQG